MSDFLIQKLEAIKNRYSHIQDNRSDQAVDDCIAIVGHEALSFKPTPDNPCGHSLCIHDVCKRCGTLGALEYMAKHQKRFVDDFDAKVATDANNAEHAKDLLSQDYAAGLYTKSNESYPVE